MIVDCYTHMWGTPDQLGRCLPLRFDDDPSAASDEAAGSGAVAEELDASDRRAEGGGAAPPRLANPARHFAAAEPADTTIVVGFVSRYLEAEIPNDRIAEYVGHHPDRLIGFAGIDPSEPKEAIVEVARAQDELGMPGLAIAPAAQDFHPSNSRAMLVYAEAAERGMPVIFHTGVHVGSATKMEYARPLLLDEVARELPRLRIIIAHMGYPWVDETVMLLAKHQHVYAETSWLLRRPWQGFQALLAAYEYGVMDKLLFGSGFPVSSASCCIEALYGINHLCQGTGLPTIPREQLRGIVERDALSLLGIAPPPSAHAAQPVSAASGDAE
ncbi:MAG: amidohydrolase family protein [Phycisphaerae bacterium]